MTELVLKRIVMIKAEVTEKFKENLIKELERAIQQLDASLEATALIAEPEKATDPIGALLGVTKTKPHTALQAAAARAELEQKVEETKKLKVGSLFIQGPLEGDVRVAVGDNLYKKVGAAEIHVRDGVITEIVGVE